MASKKTVFQSLEKTIGGGWSNPENNNQTTRVNSYNLSNNEKLFTTKNKEDYERKKLELKQDRYLANMWSRTATDVANEQIAGISAIKLMYRDVELMDAMPEIGAALDIYSEESCVVNNDGALVNVYSDSPRIKSIIEDLLVNRLSIQVMAPMVIRAMCKYGNQFMLLNMNSSDGVTGWKHLPVAEMERIENGITNPYSMYDVGETQKNDPDEITFQWLGQSKMIPFRNWQIAHFRLISDSTFIPYGCSILQKARRHFRMLSMMEDMMLIYRLDRSIERRVYKIYVGAIDDKDVPAYINDIANKFKRTPIIDPMTGQVDLRKNVMPVWRKTPIPLLDGRTLTIEELANEYDSGKTNYVYSVQEKTHKIVPGKITWCGKNYTADKMVKVTLDDGGYICLTHEHEFIMRDGTKKRADKLKKGDSVMPFYVKVNKNSEKRMERYEKIYDPNTSKYEFTHRIIAEEVNKENNSKNTVHHKDFNKYNNRPDNLEWMIWKEHFELHDKLGRENIIKYNKSEKHRIEASIRGKKNGYTKVFEQYNNSLLHKKHDFLRKKATKESWNGKGRISRINKMTVHFDAEIWESIMQSILDKKVMNRKTMLEFINKNLIEHIIKINSNKRLEKNHFISREVLENRIHENGFSTITEYIKATKKNHKVSDVEFIGGDDVYCMTVVGLNGEDDRHNFAVKSFLKENVWAENGCFVANCVDTDIFIPVRDPGAPNPIDTLAPAQNLTAIDDIKYVQLKVLSALRIPKTFLNFENEVGQGNNLSLLDVRFARVIGRIQQAFLMELTKVVTIHLYLLGFRDDLTNFNLTMNNPSTQAEGLEIDNMSKKINAVRDAVSDPGGGIPMMSLTRALKTIMHWDDSEIKDNLEEIRLEKALSAELEKTSQIIKRTNIFDPVDKTYGEPDAQYMEDQQGGMDGAPGGDMGGGAPPMGGGGDFGSGLDSLEEPEGEEGADISGEEGSMPPSQAGEDDSAQPELPNEGINRNKKNVILERHEKNINRLFEDYINRLDRNKIQNKRIEPESDNLFINEQYDGIIKDVDDFINKTIQKDKK